MLYARVSTRNHRPDLLHQVAALEQYCQQHGARHWERIKLSPKGFKQLFEDIEVGKVRQVIVAHKDRLVRFGFEWFAEFCARHHWGS